MGIRGPFSGRLSTFHVGERTEKGGGVPLNENGAEFPSSTHGRSGGRAAGLAGAGEREVVAAHREAVALFDAPLELGELFVGHLGDRPAAGRRPGGGAPPSAGQSGIASEDFATNKRMSG